MLSLRESKELRSLRQRKMRVRSNRFLAEGIRVVEDLLASRLRALWALTSSSIEDTARGRDLVAELERRRIPRRVLPEREFAGFADTEAPQGIIVVAEIPDAAIEDLAAGGDGSVVLAFDAVQDPGNLGTMIRSAEAFAARGVLVMPGSADPWNSKSVRAAAGSSFRIPIVTATPEEALPRLRSFGYTLLGASAAGAPLPSPVPANSVLVMGNEGAGISEAVAARLDTLVGIPIRGRAESLNVTAAAAILMYELTR